MVIATLVDLVPSDTNARGCFGAPRMSDERLEVRNNIEACLATIQKNAANNMYGPKGAQCIDGVYLNAAFFMMGSMGVEDLRKFADHVGYIANNFDCDEISKRVAEIEQLAYH